jgi:hypothetical protein
METGMDEKVECDACTKDATHSFNIRRAADNYVRHKCCEKHYNIAMSKLMVFLKHVRKKKKLASKPVT